MFGVNDQGQITGHEIPYFQQELQSERPQGLVEPQARLDGTHMGAGGFHHRFDPMPGLAEKGSIAHAVP